MTKTKYDKEQMLGRLPYPFILYQKPWRTKIKRIQKHFPKGGEKSPALPETNENMYDQKDRTTNETVLEKNQLITLLLQNEENPLRRFDYTWFTVTYFSQS